MNYQNIAAVVMKRLENELNKDLFYHGIHHTVEILDNIEQIISHEKVSDYELNLLKLAALFHDIGFINVYNGHEEEGCKIAKETLAKYNFLQEEIMKICGMIMATKIPQKPKNKLERIIADADLLYLGTDKFKAIGNTLFEELKAYKKVSTISEWNKIQKDFMSMHHYHTQFCKENFEAKKEQNLEMVLHWLENEE